MANNDPFFNTNSYISFDATSLRDLIVSRLNQGQIFTDQNYQGSNLSALLDVISFSFSTLLYYLNKTSSESMFSESQIYENMNRIVKLLNYKPIGRITQSVGFGFTVTPDLTIGNYIIPRYSYVRVGNTTYSFNKDIYFSNTEKGLNLLQNTSSDFYLYQGQFAEYPIYNAIGNNNEIIYVNLGTTTYLDHFNVQVYVKPTSTGVWEEWKQTENLFLNKATDKAFEVRFNPNKNYEVRFGDGINGKKLETNDQIQIYYLSIDPQATDIAANTLLGNNITFFNSINYNKILSEVLPEYGSVLSPLQASFISLNNEYPSNPYTPEEDVDSIRSNAPQNFTLQQKLVTIKDFTTYIKTNYKKMFADVMVVSNDDYLKGHIKYLYDIGIKYPQLENRILFNQIKFANSCNFNNIYVYVTPLNSVQKYINSAQKEILINDLSDNKILTSQIIPIDPVYMNLDFYVKNPNSNVTVDDISNSQLVIYKKSNTRRATSGIVSDVINIIKNTFSKQNVTFGQNIDINQLATDIVNIDGVDKIKTYRSDTNTYIDGLSLIVWNDAYPKLEANAYTQNYQLQYFQYPIFNNVDNLISRINVIEPTGVIQITDF
jgi:hypothetical protein